MLIVGAVICATLVAAALAYQTQYKLIPTHVFVNYTDPNVLAMHSNIYQLNDTSNALNMTMTFKIQPPDNTKYVIQASKWVVNDYKLHLTSIKTTFKLATQMESFDMHTLWVDRTTPPFVWPIRKGVTYHTLGWVPDSTQFPPNIPEGKWRVVTNCQFANKSDIFVSTFFTEIVYKRKH